MGPVRGPERAAAVKKVDSFPPVLRDVYQHRRQRSSVDACHLEDVERSGGEEVMPMLC